MADTNVRISRYGRALFASYQYEIIVLDENGFHCRRWTMDSKQQRREFQAIKKHDSFRQMHPSVVPRTQIETPGGFAEENDASAPLEETSPLARTLQAEHGSIAYELLLLQQRLVAYEQLHIEEMAELRQEIERLRRVFLQETNSYLHTFSPLHSSQIQEA